MQQNRTPLLEACELGHLEVFATLVAAGADPHAPAVAWYQGSTTGPIVYSRTAADLASEGRLSTGLTETEVEVPVARGGGHHASLKLCGNASTFTCCHRGSKPAFAQF